MPTTTVKRLAAAYSGGNSATLPFFTHSAGVTGYVNRWISSQQAPADGVAVGAVKPQTGTTDLVQATAARQPAYAQADGHKVLRLDGVDDYIGASGLGANAKTITVLVKMTAAAGVAGGILNAGANIVRRTSENPPRIGAAIGANSTQFFAVGAVNGWHCITLVADGATSGIYVNGAYTTLTGTDANSSLNLGLFGTTYGKLDWLEAITWNRALSAAECAAVTAAMRNHYTDITIY